MEGDFIKIHKGLLPLSWLYGLGVMVRNELFELGVLKSRSFDVQLFLMVISLLVVLGKLHM